MYMNLSTFLALQNSELNFLRFLSSRALLSYEKNCYVYIQTTESVAVEEPRYTRVNTPLSNEWPSFFIFILKLFMHGKPVSRTDFQASYIKKTTPQNAIGKTTQILIAPEGYFICTYMKVAFHPKQSRNRAHFPS